MVLKISTLVSKGKDDGIKMRIESLNDEILMTPLSRRQWSEVEELQMRDLGEFEQVETSHDEVDQKGFRKAKKRTKKETEKLKRELKMKINPVKQTISSLEAQTRAIYLSLYPVDDKLNEEDIQDIFNKEQFDEIYENVLEISGIVDNEEDAAKIENDTKDFLKDK